jgi:hypothetical protein
VQPLYPVTVFQRPVKCYSSKNLNVQFWSSISTNKNVRLGNNWTNMQRCV